MHRPDYQALTDMAATRAHIAEHPLGAWVCKVQNQLMAKNFQFVLDVQHGAHGRLLGQQVVECRNVADKQSAPSHSLRGDFRGKPVHKNEPRQGIRRPRRTPT